MNIFRYKYAIVASLVVAAWSVTACDEDDDDSNILFGQKNRDARCHRFYANFYHQHQ